MTNCFGRKCGRRTLRGTQTLNGLGPADLSKISNFPSRDGFNSIVSTLRYLLLDSASEWLCSSPLPPVKKQRWSKNKICGPNILANDSQKIFVRRVCFSPTGPGEFRSGLPYLYDGLPSGSPLSHARLRALPRRKSERLKTEELKYSPEPPSALSTFAP